ncbi:hypothetical protein QVD17_41224 [Tagetes erecta]|uniref:Secreted protein n=1 Tax=Tagetes erecta TaxID=13708 RepID=A0AAD8JWQ5_TARER|nr:hypothetical protein QVD17_41224 [Tagetes erecta]
MHQSFRGKVSRQFTLACMFCISIFKLATVAEMHNAWGSRRNHHHHHRHRLLEDNTHPYPDPGSASSLRRHVAASLMQHHHANIQRTHNAIQPVSPASYGSSSMEKNL